jgi:hypothetical protein
MPEHFHWLLKPQPADSTPRVMKEQETAKRLLRTLQLAVSLVPQNSGSPPIAAQRP